MSVSNSNGHVTDQQITSSLRTLLKDVDLQTTTEKMLRKKLEAEFNTDLTSKKALIRAEVEKYLNDGDEAADVKEEDVDEDELSEPDVEQPQARGSGFGSILSPEMQEFLGLESLPRTQVVSRIWAYIKEHNLQDPSNKRRIVLDPALARLFTSPLDMFNMNKQLSRHVKTADAGSSAPVKRSNPSVKKPASKKPRGEASAGKGGGGGLAKPVKLSDELADFLGAPEMARTQIVKVMWQYFKEKELMDPSDRRWVIADAPLKALFGLDRFQGFSLSKLISPHVCKD